MGPVLDLKERNETTMEASTSKDHTPFIPMPKDKNIKSESKHEHKFDDDDDVAVDIKNCMNDDKGIMVQPHSEDATASSSSFGNCEYESDNEVMSELHGNAAQMQGFGGSNDLLFPLRKKRVTSHWRKFVQPLMWRCKWVELQLRKFQSQAIKYEKELEKLDQTKKSKYENFDLEGQCAKSMPFFHDSRREKPMKRNIRKRHEETDTEVYMSQHNLFSYFATCRSATEGPAMEDDQTNQAPSSDKNVSKNEFRVPDELLSLDFRDDYFLEQILWKIEVSHSQVCEMKTRVNTVMTDNEARISSTEDLNLQELNNVLTCDYPTKMDGPGVPTNVANFASQLIKLNTCDDDDLVKVKPEIAGSCQGEGTHLQDANEPTEQEQPSRKRSSDGILIYNRRAKKPKTESGPTRIHPIEKLQVAKEEKSNNTARVSVSEDSSQNEQPAPKLRSVSKLTDPKNKKKRAARARRKSGSSLWSRRTSG